MGKPVHLLAAIAVFELHKRIENSAREVALEAVETLEDEVVVLFRSLRHAAVAGNALDVGSISHLGSLRFRCDLTRRPVAGRWSFHATPAPAVGRRGKERSPEFPPPDAMRQAHPAPSPSEAAGRRRNSPTNPLREPASPIRAAIPDGPSSAPSRAGR